MKPEWERGYARGSGQCWTLQTDNFKITVLDYHYNYPGQWVKG